MVSLLLATLALFAFGSLMGRWLKRSDPGWRADLDAVSSFAEQQKSWKRVGR